MVTHDNGNLFWVEGTNMALGRHCHLDLWNRLPVSWKLAAMALCCEALEATLAQPKKPDARYKRAAPVYVKCQQKDTQKIREGIPGHGPQRVTAVSRSHVHLECGCSLPLSWLPIWEKNAAVAFQEYLCARSS